MDGRRSCLFQLFDVADGAPPTWRSGERAALAHDFVGTGRAVRRDWSADMEVVLLIGGVVVGGVVGTDEWISSSSRSPMSRQWFQRATRSS